MNNTNFQNSTGLPAENHFSSAKDLAILTSNLITKFPEIYSFYKEKQFTFNEIKQLNRNKLLWRDDSSDGVKTGHTKAAGYCLVGSAKRGDMRLITVVAGSDSDAVQCFCDGSVRRARGTHCAGSRSGRSDDEPRGRSRHGSLRVTHLRPWRPPYSRRGNTALRRCSDPVLGHGLSCRHRNPRRFAAPPARLMHPLPRRIARGEMHLTRRGTSRENSVCGRFAAARGRLHGAARA